MSGVGLLFVLFVSLNAYGLIDSSSAVWWVLAVPILLFVLYFCGMVVLGLIGAVIGFLTPRR